MEGRRSPKACIEYGDTTHFIIDCPKRKKSDSSNKYDYAIRTTPATRATRRRRTASETTTIRRRSPERSYLRRVLP
jgi:hypothetical protein